MTAMIKRGINTLTHEAYRPLVGGMRLYHGPTKHYEEIRNREKQKAEQIASARREKELDEIREQDKKCSKAFTAAQHALLNKQYKSSVYFPAVNSDCNCIFYGAGNIEGQGFETVVPKNKLVNCVTVEVWPEKPEANSDSNSTEQKIRGRATYNYKLGAHLLESGLKAFLPGNSCGFRKG